MLCAESEQLVTARLSMAQEVLKAVKKQLGAEIKKSEEAQRAAKTAAENAEAQCELRVSEMRELLSRARVSIIEAEKRATEADERAAAAEAPGRRAPLPQRRPWQRHCRKCTPHRRRPNATKGTRKCLPWQKESSAGIPSASPRLCADYMLPNMVSVPRA